MKYLIGWLALLAGNAWAQAPAVEWKVENPYPLFNDAALVAQLQPQTGEAPSQWYQRLVASGPIAWPHQEETQWDQENERFRPGYLDVPIAHRVVAHLDNRPAGHCSWITDLDTQSARCDADVVIDVPYPGGTTLSVALPDGRLVHASERVVVEDLVVLGLGDSYGSGEGNPDYAARYATPSGEAWRQLVKAGPYWIRKPGVLAAPAQWLDFRCHRSLYSNQNMVALWLSAQRPNRVVRFAPLACSGAVTGEMDRVPQSSLAETANGVAPKPLRKPQVYAAKEALTGSGGLRKPELVLLSLGGNDALFAPTISQVLVPARGKFWLTTPAQKLLRRMFGFSASSADGEYVIKHELANRFLDSFTDIRTGLDLDGTTQVLWTSYADPLQRETGDACALPSEDLCASEYASGLDNACRNSAFQVMRMMDDPLRFLANPGIVSFEVDDVRSRFIAPIQRLIRTSSADIGKRWAERNGPELVLVDAPETLGDRHGICAVEAANTVHPENELRWPLPQADGSWLGVSPVAYEPYATRNRWFRSANDAALILNRQQPGRTGWGQRVRGMFHPTAEYHAHLADAMVCAMKPELRGKVLFCSGSDSTR